MEDQQTISRSASYQAALDAEASTKLSYQSCIAKRDAHVSLGTFEGGMLAELLKARIAYDESKAIVAQVLEDECVAQQSRNARVMRSSLFPRRTVQVRRLVIHNPRTKLQADVVFFADALRITVTLSPAHYDGDVAGVSLWAVQQGFLVFEGHAAVHF
ncbi:MAG: hypothetical protein Q7S87_03420 [Agitococcus sp.]|nr:hypothetical protein [Agitococcus sp.]MDO9178687.1 hypothetical protein [Agitococcus sp.]